MRTKARQALVGLMAAGVIAAMAAPAIAAKGGTPGKPGGTTTTTTAPEAAGRACSELTETAWVLGAQIGEGFEAGGLPACIDLPVLSTAWEVEWSGTTARGTVKGLKLVFEKGVHGTVYAEEIVYNETGTWTTPIVSPASGPFVFVAMPHSGDKWDSGVVVTLRPLIP